MRVGRARWHDAELRLPNRQDQRHETVRALILLDDPVIEQDIVKFLPMSLANFDKRQLHGLERAEERTVAYFAEPALEFVQSISDVGRLLVGLTSPLASSPVPACLTLA